MKELFIVWITFQLIMIGVASSSIHNDMVNKTFKCHEREKIPLVFGAIFPLAVFADTTAKVRDYCSDL